MKELVVISGKGGTGKTSLTASFAAIAPDQIILADCDVDAADLHLLFAPNSTRRTPFYSGHEAIIRPDDCTNCGICHSLCRFDAIAPPDSAHPAHRVIDGACEGCGVCVWNCPANAIDFPEQLCGHWMISDTRFAPMVHAQLAPGAENSGKLVSHVREEARKLARQKQRNTILIDGPPGTGCPVIAAVTGATAVLIVTEPTVSGVHDLRRILDLAAHFRVPASVCVNKWDINPQLTREIEDTARAANATPVGQVRYHSLVTAAQRQALAVIEVEPDHPLSNDIRQTWTNWLATLEARP